MASRIGDDEAGFGARRYLAGKLYSVTHEPIGHATGSSTGPLRMGLPVNVP